MLIIESHQDVPTKHGGDMRTLSSMSEQSSVSDDKVGIFLFTPTIPNYPMAKFPGVVVFSEIYQGMVLFS